MRDPLPDAVDPGDKLEARWTLAEDTVAWSDVAPCSVGTRDDDDERQHPVSYTHLTLPTICSV